MAASHFPTTNYASSQLVESAGGIVFSRKQQQQQQQQQRHRICILWHVPRQEYLLAKGRRDHGETRAAAALREVREEAGVKNLTLLPVRLRSRATPAPPSSPPSISNNVTGEVPTPAAAAAVADPNIPDEVRTFEASTEPFVCSVRDLGDRGAGAREIKFIWWFVMQADEEVESSDPDGPSLRMEDAFERRWLNADEAIELLTFQNDKDIAAQALALVRESYPETWVKPEL